MKKFKIGIFILFFVFASLVVLSGSIITLPNGTKDFYVTENIQVFFDKKGDLSLTDIIADTSLFNQNENDFEFSNGNNVVWIKFRTKNEFRNDEKFVLYFYGRWDTVRFYSLEGEKWRQELTGGLVDINSRTERSPYTLVNVLFKNGADQTFFARLQYNGNSRTPSGFVSSCVEKNMWLEDLKERNFIQGLFLGIIFIMALYNLFLYFSVRDKSYLYYVMNLFAMGLIFLANNRYDYEYLWPNCPVLARFISLHPFYNTFAGFCMLVFSQSFLNTKKNIPTIHKLMNILNLSSFLVLTLSLLNLVDNGNDITDMIGIVVLCFTLLSGILVFRKGYKPAKYFVIANIFFCSGTILFLLQNKFNIIPYDLKTYPMQIGSTIEMVLFSLAIADRINILKSEVTDKQEKIILQLQENEILKDKVTRELEEKVRERTAELTIKNKEIIDSINYAERIQRSFIATKDILDENLQEYFVFFKPKDIVSGDFYWASKLSNGEFVIATADSTGHGVPGAIMSLLNITSLESAIKDGLTKPSEILNDTRKTIIERLKKDGSEYGGKDGMDASLISFDFENNKFTYSAANNPVWVVRQNQLIELDPDKMPVGKHDKDHISFTQHEFALLKNDVVYTLTDGMPDQFGGPKGKKFMYKKLKELLVSISSDPMEIQKQKLTDALNNWKGDLEQVDDITLFGVRV